MAASGYQFTKHGIWNRIDVDKSMLENFSEDFIGFEELTDYSLTKLGGHDDSNSLFKSEFPKNKKGIKKIKKKKEKTDLKKILKQKDEVSDSQCPKKKKKRKKPGNKFNNKNQENKELPPTGLKRKIKETDNHLGRNKKLKTSTECQIEGKEQVEHEEEPNLETKKFSLEEMEMWKDLFVPLPVLKALWIKNYLTPTPIQSLVLPSAIRDKKDIVGAAETGSGKTLAFGIPLISYILKDKSQTNDVIDDDDLEIPVENSSRKKARGNDKLYALVLSPTRELAIQVKNHLLDAAKFTDIRVVAIVGGMAQQKQERLLKQKPEIIVATPGRLWELIMTDDMYLKHIDDIKYLVIDEADRMVEKGHFMEFLNLLEKINFDENKRKLRQTFVFSATLTLVHFGPERFKWKNKKFEMTAEKKLENLISAIGLKAHYKVFDITQKTGTVETLKEATIRCSLVEKDYYLYYILTQYPGRTLVFTNSIDCIRRLNPIFSLLKREPLPLHANMQQRQRLKHLERFTARENGLLIATDVAARGLDIPNIQHVIHFQVPRISEIYIHRSGRTARAQKDGLSVMLISPDEILSFRRICKTLHRDEKKFLSFPVDNKILEQLKQRVDLARAIDKLEHKINSKVNKNKWFQKAAEDMDIILDDSIVLSDTNNIKKQRKDIQEAKERLNHLLKRKI